MNQRNLYRTIESFASEHLKTDRDLLKHVVNEIVKSDKINIRGGRIWQFVPATESYKLIHQIGVIDHIDAGYTIPVANYPMFQALGEQRSMLGNETDRYLRKKGIVKYSATGVGDRTRLRGRDYFKYLLAFNTDNLDQSILTDLNIISLAVSTMLSRKRFEQKAKQLEIDIDKAREIQQSILPQSEVRFQKYDIYGMCEPDRIVGGDFFDYLKGEDEQERMSIVVGDAASKGMRAAAEALYVVGGLRMGYSHNIKISTLMARMNALIHQSFSEEQFVSMFYAELTDDPKGLLLYCNAGHNSPILYHVQEKKIELLEPTGQILGPFTNEKFRVANTHLEVGDVLVIYTDGITEAVNAEMQMYGEPRLLQQVVKLSKLGSPELCEAIMKDVHDYAAGAEHGDDKTVVVIKRTA